MKKNQKSSSKNGSATDAAPAAASRGWARWFVWFIVLVLVAEFLNALRAPKDKTFAISRFAELPLTFNGRVQPMDSLARNSLLQIRKNTDVPLEGNNARGAWGEWEKIQGGGQLSERNWYQFSKHPKKLKPAEWLLEVMSAPDRANNRYVFEADHPELVSLLKLEGKGVERSGLRYFTFNELRAASDDQGKDLLRAEAERASKVDSTHRNAFDRSVLQLYNALSLYMRLQATIQPPNTPDFTKDLDDYLSSITPGVAAIRAQQANQKHDEEALNRLLGHAEKYDIMNKMEPPLVVPPQGEDRMQWLRTGLALMNTARGEPLPESIRLYAQMATAYRTGDVPRFNETVKDYSRYLQSKGFGTEVKKGEREFFFNRIVPFQRTMIMYIVAFLFVLFFWFNFNDVWRRGAFWLVVIGGIIHTTALVMRMVLEGRPPVTNLYSSAIFIGWGSVVLGLILERFHRNGIGLAVASAIGFVTLIIAHQLSLSGDTMEMMRAVLDTNFWLATHVVIITLGYSSTFVAGFLAIVYVLLGVFTTRVSSRMDPRQAGAIGVALGGVTGGVVGAAVAGAVLKRSAEMGETFGKSLTRMVYGIVCFATLFSFIGTVLGGIWADQSWGRFWGWDPKENGALIIVLWNALILHARWGGMVKERGLMNLAIFGNIVTAWSWFGVNMLGIGLHSYGFMDQAFHWLLLFVGLCLLLMANGLLPLAQWASFKSEGASRLARCIVGPLSLLLILFHLVVVLMNNHAACMFAFYAEAGLFFVCMFLNLLPEKSSSSTGTGTEVPQPA